MGSMQGKQNHQPKVTPQFEKAIKALANTPPISNEEIVKRNRKS